MGALGSKYQERGEDSRIYSLVAAEDMNKASFRQMVSRFFKKYFSGSRSSLHTEDKRRTPISPPLRRDFRLRGE